MSHIHDYQYVSENVEGLVEICRTCRKRLITRKDHNQRIDNRKYLKEHVRDFCQKTGRTANLFKRFYGEGGK